MNPDLQPLPRTTFGTRIGPAPRACCLALAVAMALSLPVAGGATTFPAGAQQAVAERGHRTPRAVADARRKARWNDALADPRFRHAQLLDATERRALAADYGLEALLPDRTAGGTFLPVTNCADTGAGSLRAAVGGAASGDTVDARALACASITLTTGAIAVTQDDLTILGPGKDLLGVGTKYANRIFTHTGNGTLTLTAMTLGGGRDAPATGDAKGGCIYSLGSLALGNSLFPGVPAYGVDVRGCRAASSAENTIASGGGVDARGAISLTNSIISGNEASAGGDSHGAVGGGVYGGYDGLAVKYSEIRDNAATAADSFGGGLYARTYHANVSIDSSTFAGNTAGTRWGGAVLLTYNLDATVANSTVSGNAAGAQAGLSALAIIGEYYALTVAGTTVTGNVASSYTPGAGLSLYATDRNRVDLQSTIVAGNFRGTTTPDDFYFSGDGDFDGNANLVGSATVPLPPDTRIGVDPRLGRLANHGGVTRTHLLLAGSPAIDAGNNNADSDNDQRGAGFARVIGSAADIGATEFDPDRVFNDGFD